ncbi:hypothetical protein SUGI_0014950 [Cryptomeria japonica]|nr:hypothetical protein SUGI_0014950 [Cryptomeria japonica]
MAEKCFRCISIKSSDDACSSDLDYHDNNKSSYPISRVPTTGKSSILKIIHVGGNEETFAEPKSASEFLNQYPGYCLTSPDIFIRPWDVVSPERRLLPGEKFCLVHSSIVQRLQLELLQNISGEAPADRNNGATTSEETTSTCCFPRPPFMNEENNGSGAPDSCTRGEDHRMKDIKESSPNENETKISLPEAAHDIEDVDTENGKNKIEKAFIPPLKKKMPAAYPLGWSPDLTPVRESMSLADYIR